MKIGPINRFLLIGAVVGAILPFVLSMCLFGTSLQSFLASPQPTPGFWSGAATPMPTPVPSRVQVWTNTTFTSAGGTVFVVWSVLGAFAGEALAVRRAIEPWDKTRNAWLGAIAGSVVFIGIAVCGFIR